MILWFYDSIITGCSSTVNLPWHGLEWGFGEFCCVEKIHGWHKCTAPRESPARAQDQLCPVLPMPTERFHQQLVKLGLTQQLCFWGICSSSNNPGCYFGESSFSGINLILCNLSICHHNSFNSLCQTLLQVRHGFVSVTCIALWLILHPDEYQTHLETRFQIWS